MSYGWLTESSLIPKPSKKLEIDQTTLIDLKAFMEEQKNKQKMQSKKHHAKTNPLDKQNKGIDLRNQRDNLVQMQEVQNQKIQISKKAEIYDKLCKNLKNFYQMFYEANMGANCKQFLVDFTHKKIDKQISEEKIDYEKLKHEFYKEKQEQLHQREELLIKRKNYGLLDIQQNQEAERIAWEKQNLKEVQQGLTEEMIEQELKRKPLVLQQYEKQMSHEVREAIPDVLIEETEEKKRINDIKRKRQQQIENRKEKLKKLNIF